MRYTNEYKENCVELYRQCKWLEASVGIKKKNFYTMIRRWDRRVQKQGAGTVELGNGNRKWNCYDNSIMETFFDRIKNEMYYGFEKKYTSFDEFKKLLMTTLTITTREGFKPKQNGCLLSNLERHPCAPSLYFLVYSFLGTYQEGGCFAY